MFTRPSLSEQTVESFIPSPPDTTGPYIYMDYSWEYLQENKGRSHPVELHLPVPADLYKYYVNLDRAVTKDADYSVYVTDPSDDVAIEVLADELNKISRSKGFSDENTVNFVASFIQHCIEYVGDDESKDLKEYPRYPLETLVDGVGDCEDKSILASAVLKLMGYRVALVSFAPDSEDEPGHMGVAVAGDDYSGTCYIHEGREYYYLETTRQGWALGEIDLKYKRMEGEIYNLVPRSMLRLASNCSWVADDNEYELGFTVKNWGTAYANNAYLRACFDGGNWYCSKTFSLGSGWMTANVPVTVMRISPDQHMIKVEIVHNGRIVDEAKFDTSKNIVKP
ncbi:MAG: hypothetical protein SVY53_06630 [Chloroflexota bacterium]|nr:hypothetical protein [Chloroflexota bacterium]